MAGSARERMESNAASFSTKSLWPARKRSRKFNRLFDARVPNQVKSSLPICVQKPLAALCRAPVSSTEIQDDLANPARSTSCASSRKSSWCPVSSRCTSRSEIDTPTDCSSAVTRGSVDWPW